MMPDKVHSTIQVDVDNSNSCNNCCCFPRRQKLIRVRRQTIGSNIHPLQDDKLAAYRKEKLLAVAYKEAQEKKVDEKAQEILNKTEETK